MLANLFEQITFVFVVVSQTPMTNSQKAQAEKVKNVLLTGFATMEDIERAVMEQHGNLPENERNDMRKRLG